MRKPIFQKRWYHGKTPELQIKILKSIAISGQLSKKKVAHILSANYPDVSDAMGALLSKDFIKLSAKVRTSGQNPEKFYKITERGLRALLDVRLLQDEFWRAITLLCVCSKNPISQKEFEDYYHKFERNLLGHFNIHGYFFLTPLFDNILDRWLQTHDINSVSLPQKVIECLAFNTPLTMQKLVEEIGATEEDILEVLSSYSIQKNPPQSSSLCIPARKVAQSDINDKEKTKIYYDFIFHILIVAKETNTGVSYELSLFGVMLAIALIRYHFRGMDTMCHTGASNNDDTGKLNLFYKRIDQKEYCDTIARNYKDKIPLIFGKWNILKSQLGKIILYDSFDFLIYKNENQSKDIKTSIWLGGYKEFYNDIQTLTYNAITKLSIIYISGTTILKEYEECQSWIANDPRTIQVYNKLRETGEILKYARIAYILEELRTGNAFPDQLQDGNLYTMNDFKNIENVFRDELCFLFYLNLNTGLLSYSYKASSYRLEQGMLIVPHEADEQNQELSRLGTPRQRLMAVLTKDKDIKRWFSTWIAGIIEYRSQTSDKMYEFYDQLIKSHENMKDEDFVPGTDRRATISFHPEEYDITKICSYIDSVYDYSNSMNR